MAVVDPHEQDFQIMPANWRDLNALRHLEKVCFPKDAWPLLDLIAVLSFSNIVRLKAQVAGELVGFIAGEIRAAEDLAWIATIGVLPDYQRRGIAAALLHACEVRLPVARVKLSVRRYNQAAIRLYQAAGYQPAGVWPAYYQDGTDALVYEKQL